MAVHGLQCFGDDYSRPISGKETQWHDVLGINLQWTLVPRDEWFKQRIQLATHLTLNGWAADYPDPHTFLNVAVHLYAPWWRNADYEQLLDVARRNMTDQVERIKAYRSAERILMQEAPIMPLAYMGTCLLIKPWVKRYPISPLPSVYWQDVVIEPH